MSRIGVFFDRDGLLNVNTHYPHLVEDCYLVHGIGNALAAVVVHPRFVPIVVTNQGGVGEGRYSKEDAMAFEAELRRKIFFDTGFTIPVENWYHSWSSDDSDPFRKPNPGMLLQAAKDHDINLNTSAMFGDKPSDLIAGARAGCCALYLIGKGTPSLYDQVNSFMGVMNAKRRAKRRARKACTSDSYEFT